MKICITTLPLTTFGGAERVIISDARHFAENGNDVYLVSSEFDPDVLTEYGISDAVNCNEYQINEDSLAPGIFNRVKKIRSILDEIQPDVVISHYRERATYLALSTLPINPVFTSHVHGSILWFENNTNRIAHNWRSCAQDLIDQVPGHSEFWHLEDTSFVEKSAAIVAEFLEALALRSCNGVFVNTNQVSSELNCLYGVNSKVTPPGIGPLADSPPKIGAPIDEPYIFSVSRLDSRKRINLLIQAFSELSPQNPDMKLVIGGKGEEESKLKSLVSDLGLEDQIVFEGFIEESQLSSYYSGAEIFACPGWMSYGLTPLEAVRTNTKVALSADAFVKEVIGEYRGVKVLPPDPESWVKGLDELLDETESPPSDIAPSTEAHAETKIKIFRTFQEM
jgi:glycosyltransferase involved in cell wall biosynthesis